MTLDEKRPHLAQEVYDRYLRCDVSVARLNWFMSGDKAANQGSRFHEQKLVP